VSPAPAPGVRGDEYAAWASRIAERLPASDVRMLAVASAAGPAAVRTLQGQVGAAVLRNACSQLLTRLSHDNGAYLAGLLAGAASTVELVRARQHLDVVWTGPETSTGTGRLTAATIIDLIGEARREILLVSYATNSERAIEAALAAAAQRGIEITILAERHADNPAYTAIGPPFPGLQAIRLRWPASHRPVGAALHAKILVIDSRIALVGSANFTSRAMVSNLECGFLIRGGHEPRAISSHVTDLLARGHLERIPSD
jgi:phosphatidylserine/phosphatidylglycerophosphate/cardiolipin synthase-like enzyme